jgi:hypothetical protein
VRAVPLLYEHQLGHYPEFRRFFVERFGLDREPFAPGPVLDIDGSLYELVFTGCSGQAFPSGLRVNALAPGLEPIDEAAADAALAALLIWLVSGVGGEWTPDDLRQMAAIYRVQVLAEAFVT